MNRCIKALLGACFAVLAMGTSVTVASAASITFSTGSTTATTGSITLRDTGLGNWISSRTLSLSLVSSATCNGTNDVTIGSVTGGTTRITSPAGYAYIIQAPWTITTKCEFSGTSLIVYFRDVSFYVNAGFLGRYTYGGSYVTLLNSAGTTLSGVSSSFRSDRGSTAGYLTPFSFGLSPSVGWTYTP